MQDLHGQFAGRRIIKCGVGLDGVRDEFDTLS